MNNVEVLTYKDIRNLMILVDNACDELDEESDRHEELSALWDKLRELKRQLSTGC